MSKAIYYTIVTVTGWSASGFPIMKVTSEKHNQVYGSIDTMPTHRVKTDCRGRFETLEQALVCHVKIKEIVEYYRVEYKRLNDEMNKFHAAEYAEIDNLISECGYEK